ncbi:MAG: glycosyltransferase family 9 protein [Candidatus Omnitrophica bacterium]|nr:glycosyltransferase family 9 protein [Candidatus Omnitrophota bacterium]
MVRNILIFGHSNIGDVFYDLVVISPLRAAYPCAKIHFLTSSRCRDIVERYRGIDAIITFDRHGKNKGVCARVKFLLELRRADFDLAVVLKHSLTYRILPVGEFWVRHRRRNQPPQHSVDAYRQLLREHAVPTPPAAFDFISSGEDRQFTERFFRAQGIAARDVIVGILPLAAWPRKSWPPEHWQRLIRILTRRMGMKVMNLGKLPPGGLGDTVRSCLADDVIAADQTTLGQAMALLRRCNVFIGPDSSFLHLASCLGVAAIGLYGPTSSACFYPYFHRQNIITPLAPPSCMPCYPGKGRDCEGDEGGVPPVFGRCMRAITVEVVAAAVQRVCRETCRPQSAI